ncbi:hypothetical protein RND81_06G079200 [Saponaria officinalis]|uniref:Uncharacterized protein n=1 Tax=Saponaria officinalis TaxID=3572 RepID=A0AAW1KAC2_SAPOF
MSQRKLPQKCGDPGMFTIPCTIGNTKFHKAMLDLGASINVLPYSLYQSLKLGPMTETRVVIQLADRTNAYPKGIVEDVLVTVDKLVFPADFYVLDMEHDSDAIPIILGRPFMRTTGTKIDVPNGSITMEFEGKIVNFNIDKPNMHANGRSLCSLTVLHSRSHIESNDNDCLTRSSNLPQLPRKELVSFTLQEPPSEGPKCVILWESRDDAVKHKGEPRTWYKKLIKLNGISNGKKLICIRSNLRSYTCFSSKNVTRKNDTRLKSFSEKEEVCGENIIKVFDPIHGN